jgi:hypothetical protein
LVPAGLALASHCAPKKVRQCVSVPPGENPTDRRGDEPYAVGNS